MPRIRANLAVACALAVCAAETSAQQTPTPRVLATFADDSIEQFRVSPNGRFILLVTKSKLRMYNVATHQSWDLADVVDEVSWSRQGDRIVWTKSVVPPWNPYIWSMPIDPRTGKARGPAQRLTTGRSASPQFSPDGKTVAYASVDSAVRTMGISIVPSTGGPEQVVARNTPVDGLQFSANGKALFGNPQASSPTRNVVMKFAIDGRSKTEIPLPTGEEILFAGSGVGDYLVSLSIGRHAVIPVGGQASVLDTTGRVLGKVPLPPGRVVGWPGMIGDSALVWITTTDRTTLEMRSLDGGVVKPITVLGESNNAPVWSPDGKRIAFQVSSANKSAVGIMNADGTGSRIITGVEASTFENSILWSPDSRYVAARVTDARGIGLIDVSTSSARMLVEDEVGAWQWRSDSKAVQFRSRKMPGAGIDEVTLNGERKRINDWPLPGKPLNWWYIGDTSRFEFTERDTAAYVRQYRAATSKHLASIPSGWDLRRPRLSHSGRVVATLLSVRESRGINTTKLAVFSLTDGAMRVLDLPFSWAIENLAICEPTFLRDDSAVLLFGQRAGESTVRLYRVPLNGEAPVVLADAGVALPPLELFSAAISPDGKSVVYTRHPSTPLRSLVLVDIPSAMRGKAKSSRP